MLKKGIIIMAVVAIALTACNKSDFTTEPNATGVTITGYTGTARDVVIPATIDGVKVTVIQGDAFQRKGLTSVTIPDGVTNIGHFAFAYNQLTSVTIPASVTEIGIVAFLGNPLSSITIGSEVSLGNWYNGQSSFPRAIGFEPHYNAQDRQAGTYTWDENSCESCFVMICMCTPESVTAVTTTATANPFAGTWQGESSGFSLELTFNANDTARLYISGSEDYYNYDITDMRVARLWDNEGDLYATATISGGVLTFRVSDETVTFTKVN